MNPIRLLSAAEQVAIHLRQELVSGRSEERFPGIHQLAAELGVNHKTVSAALRLLQKEGVLVGQGRGRRQLVLGRAEEKDQGLKISILVPQREDRKQDYVLEVYRQLAEAGHHVRFASKTLYGLRGDIDRLGLYIEENKADAWVVLGGMRDELECFMEQSIPVFALLGRARRLSVAGIAPDKIPAMRAAVKQLVDYGHRRIVLLVRPERRIPEPGFFERAFLAELDSYDIPSGRYHLPDWNENPTDFQACLKKLFQFSPPTALLVDEPMFLTVTLQFCLNQKFLVPEDVSIVCTDPDPSFSWCEPTVAHIHWDSGVWARRIVRWAANVRRDKKDVRQTLTLAKFVDGGSIGPAKD